MTALDPPTYQNSTALPMRARRTPTSGGRPRKPVGGDEPDFAALAHRLRPLFGAAERAAISTTRSRLIALAAARPFLAYARQYRGVFQSEACKRGIKYGRLETRAVRYLYDVRVIDGRTSVARWADALAWLTEKCANKSDEQAVQAAVAIGGLTSIAKLQAASRAAEGKRAKATSPAPTFREWVLTQLDAFEADDASSPPDTISVRVEVVDPSGVPHLYMRVASEDVIRSAVAAMKAMSRR